MFGNFIYLIVVLLIYTTYQPADQTHFSTPETAVLFTVIVALFAGFTRLQFYRLERRIATHTAAHLDDRFTTLVVRQSMMAVAIFALDVYGLNLPVFLMDRPLFRLLPTAQALVFLGLFIAYMAIVWALSHPARQKIYGETETRLAYVGSQISFSLPVLLPWVVLSGLADIILVLPFQWPRQMLAAPAGQLVYFMTFLLAVTIFGPALIQKFWRCRPLADGTDRRRIEAVCHRAGLSYRNILRWPIFGGGMITAGVMGLVARFRYILVTDALLRFLTPEEIEAVIAHEIGHVKRRHLLFYLFFFIGYMLISFAVFDLIVYAVLYVQPLFQFITRTGFDQTTVMSALLSLVIIVMFLVYFRYIFGYFMRNFERQADGYVYRLFDSARPLISTLGKIAAFSGQSPSKPNWHHFSIRERMAYLSRCESDPVWIARHDRKMRRSITVWVLGMVAVAALGYQLNFGEAGARLNRHFLATIVTRALAERPDNPKLLATLGDLMQASGQLSESAAAYERSLKIDPDNAHVLNNLAWLYATSGTQALYRPKRALHLAERALALDPSPHVWDTLAESYFINGRYAEAVAAERRALEMVRGNRAHYEKQMDRFEKALRKKAHGV